MTQKSISKSTKVLPKLEGYNNLLQDIRSILEKGLSKAYQAVDNLKVQTYWQIGERIIREELTHKNRAKYGEEVIKRLSIDLKIHERTLYRITKFYNTYPILTTLLSELSWSHYLVLIDVSHTEQRRFYELMSVKERWSVRELQKKIKKNEYQKAKKEGSIISKIPISLPAPEDIFKNTYDWDFLNLDVNYK
jgi:hypothetical protein